MSDFSFTARCPGCGKRFAPDDGACCMCCDRCKRWLDEQLEEVITAAEMRNPRTVNGKPRPRSIWVCHECFDVVGDTPAEAFYQREEPKGSAPIPIPDEKFPDEMLLIGNMPPTYVAPLPKLDLEDLADCLPDTTERDGDDD